MKKLFCFGLLLVILQNYSTSQTKFDGKYILTTQEQQQERIDEFIFSNDSLFKYTRLKYLANECGHGSFKVNDTTLTLTFYDYPAAFVDSLRTYYVIDENKRSKGDTAVLIINIFDHRNIPLQGASAQLVDEGGFNIVDKVKKYWETDAAGNITASFPKTINAFGIKIANRGFETVVIPINRDSNQTITIRMLDSEKCFHSIEGKTVKKFYLKNIRFSGFYMREENTETYNYFKKKQ